MTRSHFIANNRYSVVFSLQIPPYTSVVNKKRQVNTYRFFVVSNELIGYTDEVGQKADEFFEIGLNFN